MILLTSEQPGLVGHLLPFVLCEFYTKHRKAQRGSFYCQPSVVECTYYPFYQGVGGDFVAKRGLWSAFCLHVEGPHLV